VSGPVPAPPPKRPARTRRLDCPNCGGVIEVRANGISVTAICASCGATVDVANDDLKIIAEARKATREPDIPIGSRGALAGTDWEVVGYQVRSNPEEGWTWDEYLLFNPYRGFRFLAHDDEGWTLFCMLRQDVPDPARLEGGRRRYAGPERSQARTDYVLGEFYWRVRVGDVAQIEQYAAPPYLLVKETTGDEIVWSRGLKLPASDVQAAFGIKLAPEHDRGAIERTHTIRVLRISVAACALLFVLHAIGFGASRSLLVFHQNYPVTSADRAHPIASAPFTVPDASGNLRIDVTAPVQNDWIDLALSLVPDPAGPSYDATRTIEYYSGYDSDGSWTEGSQSDTVLFRSIPGGSYRLLLDVDAGAFRKPPPAPATGVNFNLIMANADRAMRGEPPLPTPVQPPPPPEKPIPITIDIRRHVPAPEFFWIGLALILPYPLYRLLFKRGTAATSPNPHP
jgi:hypothetical protein